MRKLLFILLLITGIARAQNPEETPHWEQYYIDTSIVRNLTSVEVDGTFVGTYEIRLLSDCERLLAVTTKRTEVFSSTELGFVSCNVDVIWPDSENLTTSRKLVFTTEEDETPASISLGCWGGANGLSVAAVVYLRENMGLNKIEEGELYIWLLVSTLPDCP